MQQNAARAAMIMIISVTIFLLLSMSIAYCYRRFAKMRFEVTSDDFCTQTQIDAALLSSQKHDDIVSLLEQTHHIMDELNVRYWVFSGTLLGAIRDGGVIPWDDDADIAVLQSEWQTVRHSDKFHNMLQSRGLFLLSVIGSTDKIVLARDWLDILQSERRNVRIDPKTFMKRNAPFLDIFVYEPDPRNPQTLRLSSLRDRIAFPAEHFQTDEVFPRRQFAFERSKKDAILLWGPRNPFPYLDRTYGKDGRATWLTEAVLSSHASILSMLRPCRLSVSQVQRIKANM